VIQSIEQRFVAVVLCHLVTKLRFFILWKLLPCARESRGARKRFERGVTTGTLVDEGDAGFDGLIAVATSSKSANGDEEILVDIWRNNDQIRLVNSAEQNGIENFS
jgi:hypothetical protein